MKNSDNSTCCGDVIYVSSIRLESWATHLPVGEVAFITKYILPYDATNQRVRWSSSDNAIATVNPDSGLVTAQSVGTVVITATSIENTKATATLTVEVLEQEKVLKANEKIKENTEYIINAATKFGLTPADVAMVIYAEQCINVDWKDAVIDPFVSPLNVSLRLGQILISTAKKVEDQGYMPITQNTEWHGNTSTENRDQGIASKLLDPQINTQYVAAYLRLNIDLWKEKYPNIAPDKAILATLYNIGKDEENDPRPNPESNAFGDFSERKYLFLQQLLEQTCD